MKRLAIVGLGHRAGKFIDEIAVHYRGTVTLAAFCDLSQVRMAAQNRRLAEFHGLPPAAAYGCDQFGEMIRAQRVDTVLVATIDSQHHTYIVQALALGCDVITEKPMTIDADKCRLILAAAAGRPQRVRVAFNYRWAPANTAVKALLAGGAIGRVKSVALEWLLDLRHGADYFRRWHSEKQFSGGLLVHKATHHFDLVNWWTDSIPASVFATGDLMFYGKSNALARGQEELTRYERYTGQADPQKDPFYLGLEEHDRFKELYRDAETETGYIRDRNVFREGITIEDNLSVTVRYRGGMVLTYMLNAFSSREGMRAVFNGDRGRVEYYQFARSNGNRRENDEGHAEAPPGGESLPTEGTLIRVYPHFGQPYSVPVAAATGGHWGGDSLMLRHLFASADGADALGRAAGPEQGAASILVGIAGNHSIVKNQPILLADLVALKPGALKLSELV